jgi:hypothetical protein
MDVKRVPRVQMAIRDSRHKSSSRVTPSPPGEGFGGEGEASTELAAEVTEVL